MGRELLTRRDVCKMGGALFTAGGFCLLFPQLTSLALESETAPETKNMPINQLVKPYLEDAVLNIDQKTGVVKPSSLYQPHLRDAFFTCLGLGWHDLLEKNFRFFSEGFDWKEGQAPTSQTLEQKRKTIFFDDESTLFFLIWAGLLKQQGKSINFEMLEKAYKYVKKHVADGFYWSAPGNYKYWADTIVPNRPEVISYNQGFYALALEMAKRLGLAVTSAELNKAKAGYRSCFNKKIGFVTLGKESQFNQCQDVSALLPEFLSRYLLSEPVMSDGEVISTVNSHLKRSAVYGKDNQLVGVKIISGPGGEFLDPAMYAPESLNEAGCYQNGGYWPMFTLTELSLANLIEPSKSFVEIARRLLEVEMANNRRSQEYLILAPWGKGSCDLNRSGYSWNVLAAASLRISNILYQ